MVDRCDPLFPVLCVLSAAGDVFIAQVGRTAVLDCGINDFKQRLVWNHGKEQVLRVTMRLGIPTKGDYKNRLKYFTKHHCVITILVIMVRIIQYYIAVSLGKKQEASSRLKNVKQTSLEISGVTEQDAGDFTCVADGSSHTHTLTVVSGEQQIQENVHLHVIHTLHQAHI